jgi:hypothetical protein
LYTSPNIIRMIKSSRMRWAGHVAHMGKLRIAYKVLVCTPERRPLGRLRPRWEDNVKTDLKVKGVEDVDWIHLAPDGYRWRALLNTEMNLRAGHSDRAV